jgi:hypothetical protein
MFYLVFKNPQFLVDHNSDVRIYLLRTRPGIVNNFGYTTKHLRHQIGTSIYIFYEVEPSSGAPDFRLTAQLFCVETIFFLVG